MTAEEINKEDLVSEIKSKLSFITGDSREALVHIADVSFRPSLRHGRKSKISISCLFFNEEGHVCADLFMPGPAGCVDYICGLMIESFEENVLANIISSLDRNKGYVSDSIDELRKKKKSFVPVLKKAFFRKGA